MDSLIIPHNSNIVLILIVTAALLVFSAAMIVLQRKRVKRVVLHATMTFLSILSLLMIALQPRWLSHHESVEAVLITQGTNTDHLDALADSIHAGNYIFSLIGTDQWKSVYENVKSIPDAAYLKRHYPEIHTLHIIGHGLKKYDCRELAPIKIVPHFTPYAQGIKQIQWKRELILGQKLNIQGLITSLEEDENRLYLIGPGGLVDSTEAHKNKEEIPFKFVDTPNETGEYLYTLRLKSREDDVLFEESFGVVVREPSPLKILVLESTLRFETKYLKNWMTKKRNSIAIRSAISSERYRDEFLNHPKTDLSQINLRLLKRFDALIIDGKALKDISQNERKAIQRAVENNGLGVLIIPDDVVFEREAQAFSRRSFFLNFIFDEYEDLDYRIVKPEWKGFRGDALSRIPAEPFEIKYNWGMKPLIKDDMERILASVYRRGEGRIGISLIKDSYQWILQGNPQHHSAYWSYLLSEISRKDLQKDQWSVISSAPVFINQPVEFRLHTENANPVGIIETETKKQGKINLRQDTIEPKRWTGTFWPKKSGWHLIYLDGGRSYWFYVHEKESWQTRQQSQKVYETKQYVLAGSKANGKKDVYIHTSERAIPMIWFFLIFLCSSAYLWIERKIR